MTPDNRLCPMNPHASSSVKRIRIEITGVVQGVGLRPYVYKLALSNHLTGFVMNSSGGVVVEVEGRTADAFVDEFLLDLPPLARIMTIHKEETTPCGATEFLITSSLDEGGSTHVSPDISICDDCLGELLDPVDRRYLYPFINCTNCGPRYSITMSVPYDRPNTTMAAFSMCSRCLTEYNDPADRRFHAQPNACPECGPHLEFWHQDRCHTGQAAVNAAIGALKQGRILAIRGLGGFHLAVDAEAAEAVERLRKLKRKNNKPFALMAPDIEQIRRFCAVSDEEERLLKAKERPVVLLERKTGVVFPEHVAPATPCLGFMLPYTPVHHLLFFQPIAGDIPGRPNFSALVMTSGNISEEPIVRENKAAVEKLSGSADAFLFHNRDIFMRVDDSVVRHNSGQTIFLRRARGYVPASISLGSTGPQVLACGADLKNTFALTRGDAAIVSQHIGDMENFETLGFFEETLRNLKAVYRVTPEAIAHDLHPGYFSTRWALEQKEVNKWGVQHHYAHIGSVMAEKGLRNRVIGIVLDGSGYGTDGTVWGGEFMLAGPAGFERIARFRPVPLPGGEAAVRKPWMTAVSYVWSAAGNSAVARMDSLGLTERYGPGNIENLLKITGDAALSPLSSGAGRLFDAVSSLLGISDINTYEGEAAIALEAAVSSGVDEHYPYAIIEAMPAEIDFSETILNILNDLENQTGRGVIAAKFHNTVAKAVLEMIRKIHADTGISDVVLTGGVFQNRILLRKITDGLNISGLTPHINTMVPCNDGGISLGQAYLLRERLKRGL